MYKPRKSFVMMLSVLAISSVGLVYQLTSLQARLIDRSNSADPTLRLGREAFNKELNTITPQLRDFVDAQSKNDIVVVADTEVQQKLTAIRIDIYRANFIQAEREVQNLTDNIKTWQAKLDQILAQRAAEKKALAEKAAADAKAASAKPSAPAPVAAASTGATIPIIMYHYTPGDFDSQLTYLQNRGYTAITMSQASEALNGRASLPAKPVVITFDDGYSDQLMAFNILRNHNMKATFYIIIGGGASNWCIGAERRYDQGYSCGDQYMSWDQIRDLDHSGLIEMGVHTVDHLNLASQAYAAQRFQIFQGKASLEAQLGHGVSTFAYPYGSYNATTVNLVSEAGFASAVTTVPGTYQSRSKLLTLYRVRVATALP